MPPNTVDIPLDSEPHVVNGSKPEDFIRGPRKESNTLYFLRVLHGSFSVLAHILIGGVFLVSYVFAFRNGAIAGNFTSVHIVLCVLGYQILMAEGILSMSSEGGWSSGLKLVHRRRIHWALQICGSALAIAGIAYRISGSTNHFHSYHGIFGLIALIFTVISLFNGLASLYAYELRRVMPGRLAKASHIGCGVLAFIAANVCFILGVDKAVFRAWAGIPLSDVMIGFAVILTVIIIINPVLSFYSRVRK